MIHSSSFWLLFTYCSLPVPIVLFSLMPTFDIFSHIISLSPAIDLSDLCLVLLKQLMYIIWLMTSISLLCYQINNITLFNSFSSFSTVPTMLLTKCTSDVYYPLQILTYILQCRLCATRFLTHSRAWSLDPPPRPTNTVQLWTRKKKPPNGLSKASPYLCLHPLFVLLNHCHYVLTRAADKSHGPHWQRRKDGRRSRLWCLCLTLLYIIYTHRVLYRVLPIVILSPLWRLWPDGPHLHCKLILCECLHSEQLHTDIYVSPYLY